MAKKHWIICTDFLKAIEQNDIFKVCRILDAGFDIDAELKVQQTAISVCAATGRYQMARFLLAKGCSLSLKTSKGETPLHLAVLRSDDEIVELFLKNRADVTSVDNMKKTVLHYACEMGYLSVASLLIKYSKRAIINKKDDSSKTPLMYACLNGGTALIECLLANGADVNATDSRGNTALLHVIDSQRCSLGKINALLNAGADINHSNDANETALLKACQVFPKSSTYDFCSKYRENPKYRHILLLLIRRGSNVNAKNRLCETVLHLSVGFQDEMLIRTLLNHGADVNATTCMGIVPLVYACKKGPHPIISLLIDAGARFNFGYHDKYVGRTWPLPQDECNNPCGRFISLILNLLDKLSSRPPTLNNFCRITICKNLQKSTQDSVPSLPLPPSLKRFLLFLE